MIPILATLNSILHIPNTTILNGKQYPSVVAALSLFCWTIVHTMESKDYQQIGQSSNDVCIEMDLLRVGSEPVGMRCPYCQEDVMTRATYKNSSITHLVAIILGVLFWWLCCCFIPYVTKRWKNVEHYCPSCRRFLGVFSRTRVF